MYRLIWLLGVRQGLNGYEEINWQAGTHQTKGELRMESDSLPTAETKPPKLHWYQPTPGRLLVVLLAVEGVLFLSEPLFPKGWAVLIAIVSIGVTMVLMFLWYVHALLYGWRFQFSLRSLLVFTIAVAIPCSWLAVEMKRAREQREAVLAIVRSGFIVGYDYQKERFSGFDFRSLATPPPVPVWLRKLLGDDFFTDVVVVLVSKQVADNDLEYFKRLTHLKRLFVDMGVTETSVEKLKQTLPNCEILFGPDTML
jgi:hypothetical protein